MGCILLGTKGDARQIQSYRLRGRGSPGPGKSPEQEAREANVGAAAELEKGFGEKPNADKVKEILLSEKYPNSDGCVGARHQVDVAKALGKERVTGFEVPVGDKGRMIDIVADGDIAIECKSARGEAVSKSSIIKGIEQARDYVRGGYVAALVVVPHGTLVGEAKEIADKSSIPVCELKDMPAAYQLHLLK